MKRSSFKYIFYFNVVLICVVSVVLTIFSPRSQKSVPSFSVTTGTFSPVSTNQSFCPNAKSAVLIDGVSGAVLFEKNSSEKLPMASTTKIMTALAVIENANLSDIITVSKQASLIEGSSIYLREGERLTVEELLYGLLLESGNDAAFALAEGVFGSNEECVARMNEIAHKIGLVDTNFENVHGLDSQNHYTTAYELALIAKKAMENDVFKKIVSAKNYVTTGENKRYFSNHNRLLLTLEGCTGIKTGYTSKSGRCLVSSTDFDKRRYIAVTLDSKNDWKEHKSMHDFARDNYDLTEIAKKDSFFIKIGNEKYVPATDVYLTNSKGAEFSLSYKIKAENGAVTVTYFVDQTPFGYFDLIKKQAAL